ncbi:MAG: carbamoyl-phosphate synthase large subunit [Clostridia bacterium]|nr:carbamoyl-phosphate synthase large subunit [Clostridia bacterium]
MPIDSNIKKVLVIGSGPIVIGQAAEFDYAGTQACRVLKDAGLDVVLVNSNPATIMTDKALADEIYLEPLTLESVQRIIEKEKPDSLLATLGGQTGLTLSMQLARSGFLKEHNVRLLGTDENAILLAEDRELFKKTLDEIGEPSIPSDIAEDLETALAIADRIGYPVIVRPAFTLGGTGGGVANTREELKVVAATGLDASPITQILVERYIYGWKEIEFETMRDAAGNVIAVCSMENVDPVGIHTGDSVVVAPALTLSTKEFGMLRDAAFNIVSALGIVGGCNCQFALNPDSFEYAVIEVNPRVSRSSALASKATGYPIAKITTKIALGYTLDEIRNDITGVTSACFEPTVDYVVVKFPKWPFDKFVGSNRTLGTQMKATGEVMAIAPSFEMALMKAVRGAEISADTLNLPALSDEPIEERLKKNDDRRLFTVFEALKKGVSIETIHKITRIDRWFLRKMKNLAEFELSLTPDMSEDTYLRGKKLGYPDAALKRLARTDKLPTHAVASYKKVDTCAAEFDAKTPYFYSDYGTADEAAACKPEGGRTVVVLGSGPIRIGQGIEFDYSSVHCVRTLKSMGYDVVIINNNPETVSTDYDISDRLYFEPLTPEDVMNVIRIEQPIGVVVAFGGQTAIKLTKTLDDQGIRILGTSWEGIDIAEDRERFDALLEKFGFRRPRGMGVQSLDDALRAAETLGYPVLLRPSYVIGGQNMMIAHTAHEVEIYMKRILAGGIDNPVLVDKYMMGPELEVDVISDGVDVLIPGVMQHIERAGVHSGDSIAVYPPYNIGDAMLQTVVDCSTKLALALGTQGLVNIQYLIYENELYILEVNPRASRTIPYISKVTGVPMVDLASRVMLGEKLADLGYGTGLYRTPPYYAVKVPVFSFEKLTDANSYLGPEMKSTGEVLGVTRTINEALFKGITAAGMKVKSPRNHPGIGVLFSIENRDQIEMVSLAKKLDDLGFAMYATRDTAEAVRNLGISVTEVRDINDEEMLRLMEEGKLALIVYTNALFDSTKEDYIALHRRAVLHSIPCLTSLDTANALADTMASGYTESNTELVNINNMRENRVSLPFVKMQGSGNDYIYIDERLHPIECPESLAVSLCDRHYGIGGEGLTLIGESPLGADVKMTLYNQDGSRGRMGGNSIRCVAKYAYDRGICKKEKMTVETDDGIRNLSLYLRDGKVSSVAVDIGMPNFSVSAIPMVADQDRFINEVITVDGTEYRATCLSMGNPHCVIFCPRVDAIDVPRVGSAFENSPIFPNRVNTEFVRVVNPVTLKMRVWERGNGETWACGTGACAAVVAAVENGYCKKNTDITVKVRGGDLIVRYTDEGVTLTGDATKVYEGMVEY